MEFAQWLEAQTNITCRVVSKNPVISGVPQSGYTLVRFSVSGNPYAFLVDSGRVENGTLHGDLKYRPGKAWNDLNNDIKVRRSPPRNLSR